MGFFFLTGLQKHGKTQRRGMAASVPIAPRGAKAQEAQVEQSMALPRRLRHELLFRRAVGGAKGAHARRLARLEGGRMIREDREAHVCAPGTGVVLAEAATEPSGRSSSRLCSQLPGGGHAWGRAGLHILRGLAALRRHHPSLPAAQLAHQAPVPTLPLAVRPSGTVAGVDVRIETC